jgi:hypothetical protein
MCLECMLLAILGASVAVEIAGVQVAVRAFWERVRAFATVTDCVLGVPISEVASKPVVTV